ncbi:hypothetical protein N7931_06090 [Catenovulum sp. 2E275]|uniref:hypothetical protein n=1 Tax=Catenovulum sp. 2E275 TaxID=2980497 RepID=UPI0021CEB5DF|nr:hypothetical protein [Catenovulum sp. 2E275]MCU4675199.1 hypothetical protein [Catenovulum sp. 2E275]
MRQSQGKHFNTAKLYSNTFFATALLLSPPLIASPSLSGGIWFNYRYVDDNERDKDTYGDVADEALVLYVDDTAENRPWSLSAELRIGPGSFTSPANNSSGDNFALHKAWIKYQLDEQSAVYIGKSQVPFGWKTVNFWPGDMLHGGYGDQMDVGLKYSGKQTGLEYNLAYYHADDWGETSTDTVDDNGHWGTSNTYRKIQTFVADANYQLTEQHKIGLSLQAGKLQDLTGLETAVGQSPDPVDGEHSAAAIYYIGQFDQFYTKAQLFTVNRELPENYYVANGLAKEIKNNRAAIELGYKKDKWFMYLNASWAKTDTQGNNADGVSAFSPGVSYNYGPGWFYLEYLTQNGYIDANGDVGEGDFSALYASVDYYF